MNLKSLVKSIPVVASYKRERLRAAHQKITSEEKKYVSFYQQFVKPGSLCFDIGANLGNRIKILSALEGRVVAFEPQERCFNYLDLIYGNDPNVTLIQAAVGKCEGQMELLLSESSTTASLSQTWVDRVTQTERFGSRTWDDREVVKVITLDSAISKYGMPDFCKIDVEGFEHEVLAGLSQPIRNLSFEFTPEYHESTLACFHKLESLGTVEFNYSLNESMMLELGEWLSLSSFLPKFHMQISKNVDFGDIYARFL